MAANTKMVAWRSPGGHGLCKESTVHSGARSMDLGMCRVLNTTPLEIDYNKLRELCARKIPKDSFRINKEQHDQFMSQYSRIFRRRRTVSSGNSSKPPSQHICQRSSFGGSLGDIGSHMIAIHGREKREQEEIDLNTRLKAMAQIVKKLPLQRSNSEVKQLCQHLSHYHQLFPSSRFPLPAILSGLSSRIYAEELPHKGYSLPDHSGVYIILSGSIEKLTQDTETKSITSDILGSGDSFGTLEGACDEHMIKSTYPMYHSNEACILLRITQFDYRKVVQKCGQSVSSVNEGLLRGCSLLTGVSPSTLTKLAQNITWETIPNNSVILREGETITKVGIIQEGTCQAYAAVPAAQRASQVMVGDLSPGDCVGEALLKGSEIQPYTIISSSRLKIGWIETWAIRVSEVEKHILPTTELALPPKDKERLRHMHADKLLEQQWTKIRRDIVSEVLVERGISRGTSKWTHHI